MQLLLYVSTNTVEQFCNLGFLPCSLLTHRRLKDDFHLSSISLPRTPPLAPSLLFSSCPFHPCSLLLQAIFRGLWLECTHSVILPRRPFILSFLKLISCICWLNSAAMTYIGMPGTRTHHHSLTSLKFYYSILELTPAPAYFSNTLFRACRTHRLNVSCLDRGQL